MKCIRSMSCLFFILSQWIPATAFSFSFQIAKPVSLTRHDPTTSALHAFSGGRNNKNKSEEPNQADQDAFTRFTKAQRFAGADDRVVEIRKPLGLVLNQDDDTGNVYVEIVAPRGNAARTGQVKEGDVITMCSATFGDEMWSCRGAGLARVLSAIKVRSGPLVKLVFESPNETVKKVKRTAKAQQAADDARIRAQEKRDELMKELEKDEQRLKKGWFFGLF